MQRSTLLVLALFTSLCVVSAAHANDFIEGRLHQIAIEVAPDFAPAGETVFGALEMGQKHLIEQPLAAGTCYLWIGTGDRGATNLDLGVRSDGQEIAGDDAPDDWPYAQHCAVAAGTAQVEVMMISGSGQFGFRTFTRFFGGADDIELYMNYFATVYAPDGVPVGPITRAHISTEAPGSFPLPLEGGACYTIIGTPGAGVVDLDLILEDDAGQLVAADEAPDSYPVVGLCLPESATFRLRAQLVGGSGEVGWQLFREPMY